jgi:hypothetical protein
VCVQCSILKQVAHEGLLTECIAYNPFSSALSYIVNHSIGPYLSEDNV